MILGWPVAAEQSFFWRFQGQVLLVCVLPIVLVAGPSVPALASISVPTSAQSVASMREDDVRVTQLRDLAVEGHRLAAVEVGDGVARVPVGVLEIAVLGAAEQCQRLVHRQRRWWHSCTSTRSC